MGGGPKNFLGGPPDDLSYFNYSEKMSINYETADDMEIGPLRHYAGSAMV